MTENNSNKPGRSHLVTIREDLRQPTSSKTPYLDTSEIPPEERRIIYSDRRHPLVAINLDLRPDSPIPYLDDSEMDLEGLASVEKGRLYTVNGMTGNPEAVNMAQFGMKTTSVAPATEVTKPNPLKRAVYWLLKK